MPSRVDVHPRVVAELMSPLGSVGRASERLAGRVRDRAKEYAPVRTGLLRNSIISELVETTPTHIVWRVGSPVHYAAYQEHGTGPIYPRYARVLVFQINGRTIHARRTRGVPAVHYLQRALDETMVRPGAGL